MNQEPVAWISHESMRRLREGGNCKGTVPVHLKPSHTSTIPLYTAPPKREPLTEREIQECIDELDDARLARLVEVLVCAVERKLGIGGEE